MFRAVPIIRNASFCSLFLAACNTKAQPFQIFDMTSTDTRFLTEPTDYIIEFRRNDRSNRPPVRTFRPRSDGNTASSSSLFAVESTYK